MKKTGPIGVVLVTPAGEKFWRELGQSIQQKLNQLKNTHADVRQVGEFSRGPIETEIAIQHRLMAHVQSVLRNCHIINPATDSSKVAIGTDVTFKTSRDKEPQTCRIGEHGSTDLKANPPVMSYDANLIYQSLLGREKDDVYDVRLHNGVKLEVEILDIRLPAEPVVFKLAA